MAVFGLLSAAGVVLFALANRSVGGLPLLIAGMGVQGAAIAAMRPGATYLQTRFLGLRAFAEANAIQVVFQGLAMATAPPLFGIIYDRTGSYAPAYWMLVAAAVGGAGIFLALGPYRYRPELGVDRSQDGPGEAGPATSVPT
jgi:MFS family permease